MRTFIKSWSVISAGDAKINKTPPIPIKLVGAQLEVEWGVGPDGKDCVHHAKELVFFLPLTRNHERLSNRIETNSVSICTLKCLFNFLRKIEW